MADLVQNFGKGLDSYLTKEQLREMCPVAFKDAPTNPKVTSKYLLDALTNLGCWEDDNDDFIKTETILPTKIDKENPRVEIIIISI